MTCKKPQKFPYVWTEGNTLPEIGGKLKFDISSHTITLNLRRPDGTIIQISATVVDAPNGLFKFKFGPTDLVAGKNQTCEVVIADASGEQTKTFLIDVREELS
jgi:hypothetical protein